MIASKKNPKGRPERNANVKMAVEKDRTAKEQIPSRPVKGDLWIVGHAVQDVTVQLDLERTAREYPSVSNSARLGQSLLLKKGLCFTALRGLHRFTISMDLSPEDEEKMVKRSDGFLTLQAGGKYTLKGDVLTDPPADDAIHITVHCDDVSWGGGGVNAVRFIRAICPDPAIVPITYTDVAMNAPVGSDARKELSNSSDDKVLGVLAKYSPDRFLEVFLKSVGVKANLYHPHEASFRRNWVFSRIRSSTQETTDKIICRSGSGKVDKLIVDDVDQLLRLQASKSSIVFINSLKSEILIRSAYEVFKTENKRDSSKIGVMAMTASMNILYDQLVRDLQNKDAPRLTLVFNEDEFFYFAQRFDGKVQHFMPSSDDVPNLMLFAKLVETVLRNVPAGRIKLFVTLGPRGSLGVVEDGRVIFVSTFTRPRATIFDTNACGDAYCGAIALLEWAAKNGYENIARANGIAQDPSLKSYNGAIYYMAVASAAAYAKATNRRGDLDGQEVRDLLENSYIACRVLKTWSELINNDPDFMDASGRLQSPGEAVVVGVTKELDDLMRAQT